MASIDDLERAAAAAEAEAEAEPAALGLAVGEAFAEGIAAGIVETAPEHRLLTDEEAMRRVIGDAPPDVARVLTEDARHGIAAVDRAYAENNTGA